MLEKLVRVDQSSIGCSPIATIARLTAIGLHHAMLLSHIHTRLLLRGLAQLTDPDPPASSTMSTAARNCQRALDQLTHQAGLAA